MATFHDIWPDWEMGVKRMPVWKLVGISTGWKLEIPLRPTLLRFKLSMARMKRASPAAAEDIPETSYCSHSMGALMYSKISFTESVISAPIPSPGMRVTYWTT